MFFLNQQTFFLKTFIISKFKNFIQFAAFWSRLKMSACEKKPKEQNELLLNSTDLLKKAMSLKCKPLMPRGPKALCECYRKFGDLENSAKQLVMNALTARKKAYVPYSQFKVGAAFRTTCGRIFCGCNIEIFSLASTQCAERTAIVKAVSSGYTQFCEGAICAYQKDQYTTPCCVCRQFMSEFAKKSDVRLYVCKARDDYKHMIKCDDLVLVTSLYNLLPHTFRDYR